jgi:hypothetical protein
MSSSQAALESAELLTLCIKRVRGLQKVRLVDAGSFHFLFLQNLLLLQTCFALKHRLDFHGTALPSLEDQLDSTEGGVPHHVCAAKFRG